VIFGAVVVACNLELAERRKQALHTASERNPEEVAAPIVVHMVAVEAVHKVVVQAEVEVAASIAVHLGVAVVQAAHMVVAHTAVEVAVPNLVVAVDLDHKTWINPSCRIFILSHCYMHGEKQFHTTGVKANRQVPPGLQLLDSLKFIANDQLESYTTMKWQSQ
jgi:hypothetical protein